MTAVEIPAALAARQRVDRIKVGVDAVWHLIVESYQARDWDALGYATWDELCLREFGTSRLRLPREERTEVVGSLRDAGLSLRAISAATGQGVATVHRSLAGVPNGTPAVTVEETTETSDEIDARLGEIGFEVNRETGEIINDPDHILTDEECEALAEPAPKVTGIDGKSYPSARPAEVRKRRQTPLPDAASEAGWQIRKAADRIEQVLLDERFARNKEQVSTALRGHLLFVADAVAAAIGQLSTVGE